MMNRLFGRGVYIRLTDGDKNFACTTACTTRFGKFFSRTAEFALSEQPVLDAADQHAMVEGKKKPSQLESGAQ